MVIPRDGELESVLVSKSTHTGMSMTVTFEDVHLLKKTDGQAESESICFTQNLNNRVKVDRK